MSNFNTNNPSSNRNNPPSGPFYPAGPRGNDNGNSGQNPPGAYSSYLYPRGGYSYNDGHQYGYSPHYPRNAPSQHNPNVNPPAAQWRAHQPGQVYGMPVARPANRPPPMDNQRQATKPGPDQPKENKPTSLDVDTMIQEESAKAKAKAAIDARKADNPLNLTDKTSAHGEETTRSEARGGMSLATNRLLAKVDSPMGVPGNTRSPNNLDTFSDRGPSASESQPTIPAEGPTISGAKNIPLGPSKDRRGGAGNIDEAPSTFHDQDVRDWLILTGFYDVNVRNEKLQSFRQLPAEKRSVVSNSKQTQHGASQPQGVKEGNSDEAYMGKVKDLARRMRGEFPPELLRELAATETPREPGPPENLHNRVTSKADAREMAREMAKRIDTSNLPTLRSSPSPHLDHHNDQRREQSQDRGHYRDRRDRRDVQGRRESMERVPSARYRDELTSLRAGSEQYHSRYHAYDQHDGRPSDSRRSRSPRQHAQTYRARPPMGPSAEPKLSSRQINSERRVRPWQEWKADYTRRRYE